jgi:nucleoside-diphosphate-sugar epimerase
MRVFIAGATGAIGRFAVPALIRAGHDVTAVARSDSKAQSLAKQGATPVRVSVFDGDALRPVLAGHEAVINIATHIPSLRSAARVSAWAENDRIRSEGSATLANAAQAANVRRYVQESITFIYPDRGDAWIDEDMALEVPHELRSVMSAEESTWRFTAAGGNGVVLRFGALYGPGSEQSSAQIRQARRHMGFVFGRRNAYISSLHLADAGSAIVAALSAPAGIYNAVDDEPVAKQRLADAVAAAVGARAWFNLPGRLSPLVARGPMAALARSHRVSNARLRHATGWAPRYRSVREGWDGGWVAAEMTGQATSPGMGREEFSRRRGGCR